MTAPADTMIWTTKTNRALSRRNGVLVGVLRGDHEDAADRARRRAQLAPDAALEAAVVAAQVVTATVPLRTRALVLGVRERDLRPEELGERGLEAADEGGYVTCHARPFALWHWW